MTAAMTTLELLDELDAPTLASQRSDQLRTRLMEIAERYDVIDHLGGDGLMLSIHFGDSATLSEAGIDVPDNQAFAAAVANELYAVHRVAMQLAGPKINALIALPPVNITDDEMVWFTDAIEAVLAALYVGQGGVPATILALAESETITGILPTPLA
jgi:4-aminobutyrate aminotransferase-like enzyme